MIGIISGVINNDLKKDSMGALERIAKIGYKGFETGRTLSVWDQSKEVVKQKMDELGIKFVTMHVGLEALKFEFDEIVEDAKFNEASYICLSWAPCTEKAWILETAAFLDERALQLADLGFTLIYHNHDHEISNQFDGVSAIDLLIANTKHLKFLVDTCWARVGGTNPAELIRSLSGRVPVLHIKDMRDFNVRDSFVEVGDGAMDFAPIIEAARAAGVEWYVVEQDKPYLLSGLESAKRSYEFLKKSLDTAPQED
ncbi:MAG: sugar phosphate isomerase/epimerase [Bacillota bacterium]